MAKQHSHLVRLVGTDGQEQAVIFVIEGAGVHLTTEKAQVSVVRPSRADTDEIEQWC